MSSDAIYSAEKADSQEYYVYVYLDPTTREPFYVGKGKGNRAMVHIREAKNPSIDDSDYYNSYKLRKIRKILATGVEPIIDYVLTDCNEEDAFELEEFLISEIGRSNQNAGPLVNLTDGGEGNSGLRYTMDDSIHTVYSQSGETYTGTRLDIRETLMKGNHNNTAILFNIGYCQGWSICPDNMPDKLYVPPEKVFEMYDSRIDEVIHMTKKDCDEVGIHVDCFLNLVRGKAKIRSGMTMIENIDVGKENFNKLYKKHKFTNIITKETIECTMDDLAKMANITCASSVSLLIEGKHEHLSYWVSGDHVSEETAVRWDCEAVYHIIDTHTDTEYHLTKEQIQSDILPKDKNAVNAMLLGRRNVGRWCLHSMQDQFRSQDRKRYRCRKGDIDIILTKKKFREEYETSVGSVNAYLRGERSSVNGWVLEPL